MEVSHRRLEENIEIENGEVLKYKNNDCIDFAIFLCCSIIFVMLYVIFIFLVEYYMNRQN
jgi:hypothetical protein